jgi:ribonuclease P protein subunit POP4
MRVTPDIVRYEFIGTEGKVAKSSHEDYVGIAGQVIGETRNTFVFQSEGKAKKVLKELSVFNFKFNDGTVVEIDGRLLVGRPEDRLKKNLKRFW